MANKLQLLRNETITNSYKEAFVALSNQLAISSIGEPVINIFIEDEKEHILFGIKGKNGYQIFEGATFDEDGNIIIPDYIQDAITEIINNLNVNDTAVDGKFVTSVNQTNGKIDIVRGQVNSDKVVAAPIKGDDTTVFIDGDNIDLQIKSIGKTLKEVQDNAAKYEVVKLTSEEITELADENVKEAYKVVSYTGDKTTAIKTQVGETIKIYKDSSLKSVTTSGDENTVVIFVYTLSNGKEETVTVDLGKAIFESEMGDGIKLVDNKIAIKLDTDSETFLTVGNNGLKLSGVQNTIDTTITTKINELDATVGSMNIAENKHIAVQVVEENGKLTSITVTENDIASSSDLDAEIERAKGAEKTNADAITAMKLTTIGGNGKFIKTISQNDGVVTATAEDLKASNVNLETISKDDVILDASNVQLGIQKLFEKIKELEDVTEIDCGIYY